jgi:HK97 family phage portal protein
VTVVQTVDGLESVHPTWAAGISRTRVPMYGAASYDYATLYRLQPNVRTCVDFLARNIAHLGIHVYRRVSDTDRVRLSDHPLAKLIKRPLPPRFKVTRYRLIESLVGDLGIYHNAYWLKVRAGVDSMGLLRIPPVFVSVEGGLVPSGYTLHLGGRDVQLDLEEVVHFRGFNPENAVEGLSPLETLRRVLAEEAAMGEYREGLWQNGARMYGIVERPVDAPEWSDAARGRFVSDFDALYGGQKGSGKTAVLEDGMKWHEVSFSAQEAEYLTGRKLTREECARAYHIPLPMVGILDHATYSNIKEQHKNLYQDCLGPWLSMIEEDMALQLLPEFGGADNVYVEFNLAEKLQGSFEEQAAAFSASVGRPYMTADEARARLNLPQMGGQASELVVPLNVLIGDMPAPTPPEPPAADEQEEDEEEPAPKLLLPAWVKANTIDSTLPVLRGRHAIKWTEVLGEYFRRQERSIISRLPKGSTVSVETLWRDPERWNRELYDDLVRLNTFTASAWADNITSQFRLKLDQAVMVQWVAVHSKITADAINGATYGEVASALLEAEAAGAVQGVFLRLLTSGLGRLVRSGITSASNFGAQEGARQAGLQTKVWQVNSGNPRSIHAALSGEAVGIKERFSNGMKWPGDPAGGPENNSNCQCSLRFGG